MEDNIFKKLRYSYLVKEKPISIRGLASLIEIGNSRISELERGLRPASKGELLKYHEFFKISLDILMNVDTCQDVSQKEIGSICTVSSISEISDWLLNSKEPDEIILRQTLEFIMGTSSGMALLFCLSEYLWSVENYQLRNGAFIIEDKSGEVRIVTHQSEDNLAAILAERLALLREPRYRTLSYNDIRMCLGNIAKKYNQ